MSQIDTRKQAKLMIAHCYDLGLESALNHWFNWNHNKCALVCAEICTFWTMLDPRHRASFPLEDEKEGLEDKELEELELQEVLFIGWLEGHLSEMLRNCYQEVVD